ncbi:aminotransferase, class I and II [Novosphingobium nitrogenifigens DSM 19370]|uniref:Aminotransferase n=1 Tax=Novosphingobium nitrogenifigens DSM 19370 TaxID=983920 RepID=F1Z395_9SPHN|nr:aminotransferase class I/II-fold pyridoxal phosphate-dependent enzyme [Novosphingobium nitrogenifigens]EGD60918.1 aminotransferase, class I and II [Novosphingobium nitrogenifigens DSM 19370]
MTQGFTQPFTGHGGSLDAARAWFGARPDHGPECWIDLSTGINPHAWPSPWREAEPLEIDWRRLPEESELRALETVAAAHFGLSPDHVCAVPGTELGMRMVGEMIAAPAFHLAPAYRTHGEMIADSRPLAREAIDEADGASLILANPNNPDGHLFDSETLFGLLARRGEGWLIVDEAFADTHPRQSVARAIADDCPLIVLRSFGKFFGLAGARVGFVLGPRPLLARLRRRMGAWPISAGALTLARAAYADTDWIADMRDRLADDADRLDAVLRTHGLSPRGACPLFRLVETPQAGVLFERLARQGILTRPFAEHPDRLRFGLAADESELARLDRALRHG